MKIFLLLFFLPIQLFALANMANPLYGGSLGASPFLNTYVSVLHEDLSIRLSEDIGRTDFNVKYHIRAEKDSLQIPFLFYASEYLEGFEVWIDGKKVELKDIPDVYGFSDTTKFKNFAYFFEEGYREKRQVVFDEPTSQSFYVEQRNMLYFEGDISRGLHVIEVKYSAKSWVDHSDWINEYSVRYALSPAKYWKSFGTLNITVDATEFKGKLTSNVRKPDVGSMDSVAVWHFKGLPKDIFQITFSPKINSLSQTLINVGPMVWTLLFTTLLIIIHVFFMWRFRKRKAKRKISIIALAGVIFVPLISLFFWWNSYAFIDYCIGEYASKKHGYVFLGIVVYPFFFLLYCAAVYVLNREFKRKAT